MLSLLSSYIYIEREVIYECDPAITIHISHEASLDAMRAQLVALQAELAGRAAGVVTGKTMGFKTWVLMGLMGLNMFFNGFTMVLMTLNPLKGYLKGI
jgi:hypothetical protein